MADTADLARRVQQLEDREAIRSLKARYLASCDLKQPAAVRACFCDGTVAIDYGAIGRFDTADALVAVFTEIGCHPHMVEMHHGANPEIELLSETEARGRWGLRYVLINTRDNTLTQLAGRYEDGYRKIGGEWKISATRFEASSTLVLSLGADAVRVLLAARTPPGV